MKKAAISMVAEVLEATTPEILSPDCSENPF